MYRKFSFWDPGIKKQVKGHWKRLQEEIAKPLERRPATLMHPKGKVFLKSTTDGLDEVLAVLTPEDQHDLLDALAGEIESRLEKLIDGEE